MDPINRLLRIMARLRGPGGCPWDREQDFLSLRPYVLEEAHEVAEALDAHDPSRLRDELGDLLFQVVFLSRIAEERHQFRFEDVARSIADKLERRHPHVFAGESAATPGEVWQRWDEIKRRERAERGEPEPRSRLDGIPRRLPALARARLIADKAARSGYDWPRAEAVLDKVEEEIRELREALGAGDAGAIDAEIGDLLLALASFSRKNGVDAEGALSRACERFAERFHRAERTAAARGTALESLSAAELDALWEEVKRAGSG